MKWPVPERTAAVSVWAIWAFLLSCALTVIAIYGRDIPLAEDWLMVRPLTGREPDLAAWAWWQNNEHRLPLPKLVYLLLLKLSGGDFRIGMVFNALALGMLAAAMVLTVRELRGGRIFLSDAFIPVVLLHLGHWPNLVWSWSITYVVAIVLMGALLIAVVRARASTGPPPIGVAACLLLLPLSGVPGLIMALAMAPWALYAAWRLWHEDERAKRRTSLPLVVGAVLGVVLVGLYFVGYQRAYWNPASPGLTATLETGLKFAAMSIGPVAKVSWRLSSLVVALVMMLAAGALILAGKRGSWFSEPFRLSGLVFYLGGLAMLVLAMGWGRAGSVPRWGMPPRYVLLAVPLLLFAYFVLELYGPILIRRVIQTGLFVGLLVLLPFNTGATTAWREWYRDGSDAVARDLSSGMPLDSIARRHRGFLMHWEKGELVELMTALRESGIGPFGHEASLDEQPSSVHRSDTIAPPARMPTAPVAE